MSQFSAFCLFMLVWFTINAQTVNLHGKVTSSDGEPIADAVVRLVGQELKDTTGSDGLYTIILNEVTVIPLLTPQSRVITLESSSHMAQMTVYVPTRDMVCRR